MVVRLTDQRFSHSCYSKSSDPYFGANPEDYDEDYNYTDEDSNSSTMTDLLLEPRAAFDSQIMPTPTRPFTTTRDSFQKYYRQRRRDEYREQVRWFGFLYSLFYYK